ncbi:membrane protein insertase YidC [Ligilactobacillus cholophilus]|uniref:membrane protein insertase YidC n=1 Tax=Ligilactobacillus cholophilus TaxID=3050131 RepID=UPI0025B0D304|nr:membrane protein insertase YidC [Ligilactobacillus cholophilus]
MKKKKVGILAISFLTITLFLGGCVQRTSSGKPYGIVYDWLAVPTQHLLTWIANLLNGSYGWAIVFITIVVRLLLMPLMLGQMKKSTIQQEKIAAIQPQLMEIQKQAQNAQSQEEQMALSQEMMALYRENEISMTGGIGCLPLIIQMPIFAALYAAIQYSPDLAHSSFFGINLAGRSFTFVALTFLIYALQGWLATRGMPDSQMNKMTTGMMMIYTPVMFAFMTWIAPAGLGLYFFAGGIIACFQTLLVNGMRPKIKAEIAKEMAQKTKNKPKKVKPIKKQIHEAQEKAAQIHENNRQRNAGKQNHKK